MMNPFIQERGAFSTLVFKPDSVIKTSRDTFDDEMEALSYATRVWDYRQSLAAGPIAVARMLDTGVLEDRDGFKVQHVVERIPGVSVGRLEPRQRLQHVASLLADLALAARLPDDDTRLAIPIDAKVQNYHLNSKGESVFVDFFPAFGWEDGVVRSGLRPPTGTFEDPCFTTFNFGFRAGAMAWLITSAIDCPVGGALDETLYAPLLPDFLDSATRADIPAEIGQLLSQRNRISW